MGAGVGAQNKSSPAQLLWSVDCSALRAILASGQRETSAPPFNYPEGELGALAHFF